MTRFTFKGGQGDILAARLDQPAGDIRAYALFAHCFTCTKDILVASHVSKTLQKRKIAVVRFDFTGLGGSEGNFSDTNFSSNIADLLAAADFMRDTLKAPSILIGHSLGGAAVLAAAKHIPEAKAVATLAAPAYAAHVAENFKKEQKEIIKNGEAEVQLAGRPFIIKKQFLDDIHDVCLKDDVRALNKALLVMHSPLDHTVSVDNAAQIFSWAKHPKSYISLDDADHLISRKEDAAYVANIIAAWTEKYLRE